MEIFLVEGVMKEYVDVISLFSWTPKRKKSHFVTFFFVRDYFEVKFCKKEKKY